MASLQKSLQQIATAVFFLSSSIGCSASDPDFQVAAEAFRDYWYQGKAEITSYRLSQARYGEIHTGTAVLLFVTEPFSQSKQVKLDRPADADQDLVPVLKLNASKSFLTGIYPYSIMESVFTEADPTRLPTTLKVSASCQEWCGQTYSQVNRTPNGYHLLIRSYFESEGDQELELPAVWLENEIWNLIRVSPSRLPTGQIEIVPSLQHQRLLHLEPEAVAAFAELETRGSQTAYRIHFLELDRKLTIRFSSNFPFTIESWEDSFFSGWGEKRQRLTTTATRDKRILSTYWEKNANKDRIERKKLGF